MKPQVREAVGWLLYDSPDYLTLAWDRDADPPTLKGGDPKASGLCLLKAVILELKRLACSRQQETSEYALNCKKTLEGSSVRFNQRSEKLSPKINNRKGQK